MNEEEILIVKKTWKSFRGIDPYLIGDIFYSKLFSDNPALRKLFPTDMHTQYKKLIDMIGIVVAKLDRREELTIDLQQMATRHVKYGVRYKHYSLVGDALLWTLEKGLGKEWTPAVKNAWTKCYQTVAVVMTSVYK
jgi:hemoglobin-like flavoprotein